VLRKISVPKRDEITGGWRKVHNVKLHNLSSWNDQVKKMRWEGVASMEAWKEKWH
jgi:hypothetical protein